MKTVGFIGYGQMNSMLTEGFLQADVLKPEQVVIATRTLEKALLLKDQYPGVRVSTNNREVAKVADIIIIGVRPLEVAGVVREICDIRSDEIHIVSIAACITTDDISRLYPGAVTRILPSICSSVGEGISLCYHHLTVNQEQAIFVQDLFSSVSTVKLVDETLFEAVGDLTSCGPALLSKIFIEFAQAGSRHSSLTVQECLEMVVSTAFGTTLMLQERTELKDLISMVATPGGITEEGVKILEEDLPPVFNRVFETTLAKYDLVKSRAVEDYLKP
jgi:pyrroline-5-carboxylate reductase